MDDLSVQQSSAYEEPICMTSYENAIDIMAEIEGVSDENEANTVTPPRGTEFGRRTISRKEKVKPAYSSPSMIRNQRHEAENSPNSVASGKNTLETLVMMADPVTDDDATSSGSDSDEKREYRLSRSRSHVEGESPNFSNKSMASSATTPTIASTITTLTTPLSKRCRVPNAISSSSSTKSSPLSRDFISNISRISPFRSYQKKDLNTKEPFSPIKSLDLDIDNDAYSEPLYKDAANPTGMVISAQPFCLAKEAILDPTWLDSFHDAQDEESKDSRSETASKNEEQEGDTMSKTSSRIGTGSVSLTAGLGANVSECSTSVPGSAASHASGDVSGLYVKERYSFDDSHESTAASNVSKAPDCLSLASSLSFGSCGFGKMSQSLSGSDFSYASSSSLSGTLSREDIIDMGVGSLSVVSNNDDNQSGNSIKDLYHCPKDSDLSSESENETEEPNFGDHEIADDKRKESLYLPSHLVTPPRLRRGNDDLDFDDTDTVDLFDQIGDSVSTRKGSNGVRNVPVVTAVSDEERAHLDFASPSAFSLALLPKDDFCSLVSLSPERSFALTYAEDDQSYTSCSDETNICTNCSPECPLSLDNDKMVGFVQGNIFLSILDCPGLTTREKRAGHQSFHALGSPNPFDAMVLSFRAKNNEEDLDDAECDENDKFSWGRCTVSDSLLRFKKMKRTEHCDSRQSDSIGGNSTESIYDADHVSNLPPSPQSQNALSTSGSKSPHRLKRLEIAAIRCVQKSDYKGAIRLYEQILSMYRALLNRLDVDSDEYLSHEGIILHNIGIVYTLDDQYYRAIDKFKEAAKSRENCLDSFEMDYINNLVTIGLMSYATEDFYAAEENWRKATSLLKASPSGPKTLLPELLNNLACVQFENACPRAALKSFEEVLELVQKNTYSSSFVQESVPSKETLLRLSIVKSNIGYLQLRTRKTGRAISSFQDALRDQEGVLENHEPLVITTMDYLALSNLQMGKKQKCMKTYSNVLKNQIEGFGVDDIQCAQTLSKINLLQLNRRETNQVCSYIRDINSLIIENNDRRQQERFERLVKISGLAKKKRIPFKSKKLSQKKYW